MVNGVQLRTEKNLEMGVSHFNLILTIVFYLPCWRWMEALLH